MKIYVYTQVQENYGAHDWDGEGECPQYWKFKGGNDYFIPCKDGNDMAAEVMVRREQMECDNHGFREHIVGYDLVSDDFMTEFEKNQLDYDGRIAYPTTVLK
jgi:hypothetical protein